jgi:hypothetical protein
MLVRLAADLHGLEEAMQANPGAAAQRDLRRAGAYLAAFMAMTTANLGYKQEARRWWRTARRAADAVGDANGALWIRGRETIDAWYANRPVPVILRLAEEAEARIEKTAPSAGMHELLSGKAQVLALVGQQEKAEAAMSQLRESFFSVATPLGMRRDSLFNYSEDCLRYVESLVYTCVQDFKRADAAQTAAVTLYGAPPPETARVTDGGRPRARSLMATTTVRRRPHSSASSVPRGFRSNGP